MYIAFIYYQPIIAKKRKMAEKRDILYQIFLLFLTVTLLLSGALFFRAIVSNDKAEQSTVKTWEFPMLLALLFDNIYIFGR